MDRPSIGILAYFEYHSLSIRKPNSKKSRNIQSYLPTLFVQSSHFYVCVTVHCNKFLYNKTN